VLTALLFMLAGVDEETIAEEYSLTDQGLAHLRPLFIERLLKNPALEGNREGVGNMVSSKRENMTASIAMIKKDFGGAEEYMQQQCGLSSAEIEQLRKNLVQS
jgi:protein tyrosine/serine phosphatase